MNPQNLPTWAYKACEEIDAGVFSGDTFWDPKNLEVLEYYVKRWGKEIKALQSMLRDSDD